MFEDFSEKLQRIGDDLLDAKQTLGESVIVEGDPLPRVEATVQGWQVYDGGVPQGRPFKSKIDAEIDAERFITEGVFDKQGPTSGHECQCTGCGNFYDDTLMQCPNCNSTNVTMDETMDEDTVDAVKKSAKKFWKGSYEENYEEIDKVAYALMDRGLSRGDAITAARFQVLGESANTPIIQVDEVKSVFSNLISNVLTESNDVNENADRLSNAGLDFENITNILNNAINESGLPRGYDEWRTTPPEEPEYDDVYDTMAQELNRDLSSMDLTGYTREDEEFIIDDAIGGLKSYLPDELENGIWFADQYNDLYALGKTIFDRRVPAPVEHTYESVNAPEILQRLAGIKL